MDIEKLQQLSEQATVLADTPRSINDMFAGIVSTPLPTTQAVLPGAAYMAEHHKIGIHTGAISALDIYSSSREVNSLFSTERHKTGIHTGAEPITALNLYDSPKEVNSLFAARHSAHLPTEIAPHSVSYLAEHHKIGIHTGAEPITALNVCGSSRAVNGLLAGMDSAYLPTTQVALHGASYLAEHHKVGVHTGAISALDIYGSSREANNLIAVSSGAAYLAEHRAVSIHTVAEPITALNVCGSSRAVNGLLAGMDSVYLPTTQVAPHGISYLAEHHKVGVYIGAISALDGVSAAYLPITQAVLPSAACLAEHNLTEVQQQQLLKLLLKELKAKGVDRQPQIQVFIERFTVEVYMGDSINVGNDSTLINRSTLVNSLNQVSNENQQVVIAFSHEVKRLLEQLHSTNPSATEPDQVRYIDIATPPALKQRVISAFKEGADTAIDEFILENKYLKVAKSVVKGWLEPGG